MPDPASPPRPPGPHDPGFDTLALHAGADSPDPTTGARAVPIYATTSFVFRDSDHAASLFNMERSGHVYSRISNPTVAVLEERIAALEGGVAGLATASGQAAMHLAACTIAGAGSHIVASRALYGGSHNLLAYTLPRFGIETTFVDPRDLDAVARRDPARHEIPVRRDARQSGSRRARHPAASSAVAHERGLPLVVDSTFTTPWLMKPFEHGADLLFHSATKFIGGHGVAVGGLIVDGGRFDWEAAHAAEWPLRRTRRSRTRASTTWSSRRSRRSRRSRCARVAKGCATSARA